MSSRRQVQIVRERLGAVHLDEFARTIRLIDEDVAAFVKHMRENGEPLRQSAARWQKRLRLFRRLLSARIEVQTDGRADDVVITISPKLVQAMQTMTPKEWDRMRYRVWDRVRAAVNPDDDPF